MALTNAFYEAVQSGNVRRVRIMMQDSLLLDPTFTEFHAMEKAASSMVGLYDAHDGDELLEDRSLWNDEYMDKVMVEVLSNFSHERIDHLKEVVHYLRPVQETATPQKEQPSQQPRRTTHESSYQEEKRRCQENGDYLGAKYGAGAAIGAAACGLIAAMAGASVAGVVGSAVAGAAVGGVTTVIIVHEVEK